MNDPDFFNSAINAGTVKAKKWLLVFKVLGAIFVLGGLAVGVPAVINSNWWNVFWGAILLLLGLPTLGVSFYLESKLAALSQTLSVANSLKKQFDQRGKP